MSKLKTVARIFQDNDPGRACAICSNILCEKFSHKHLFGTIKLALLKKTFRDASTALRELEIPFVLAFGTALGIRRDGELIKHDGDIDFAIFRDALRRVSLDPDERDRRINNTMKKHSFEPRISSSVPWYHAPRGWKRVDHVPVMYQYIHSRTNTPFDIYLLAEYDGFYWSYGGGGMRFPITSINKEKYNKEEYSVFPDRWLTIMYGAWEAPKTHGYEPDPNWLIQPEHVIPPLRYGSNRAGVVRRAELNAL